MGRIIDRRRVMGGKLPYDAEIEYLESTGTQYIDTGYTPIIGDSVHVEFTQPINNNFNSLYSAGTSKYQLIFLADNGGAYLKYFATGGAPYFDYKPIKDRWYVLDINGNGTATIDNYTITSTPQNAIDGGSITLWLLLRRNNTSPFVGKIRRFWLENNGVRKIDFIPVRVGQVGYMYDKVSGQLFGNNGTGAFILGLDKEIKNLNINVKTHSTGNSDASLDVIIEDREPVNILYNTVMSTPWSNSYIAVSYPSTEIGWNISALTPCLYDGQVYQKGDLITNWDFRKTKDITIIANI